MIVIEGEYDLVHQLEAIFMDDFLLLRYTVSVKMHAEQGKETAMIYPFMTLEDATEITHSEMLETGEVKVFIETPDAKDGFHSMVCYLPSYRVEAVRGYTQEEVASHIAFLKKASNLIIEFAQEGGFDHASAV